MGGGHTQQVTIDSETVDFRRTAELVVDEAASAAAGHIVRKYTGRETLVLNATGVRVKPA